MPARCLPLPQCRWVFWLALAASLSAVLDGFNDAHPRGGVPRPRVAAACAFSWLNWWALFCVCTCASMLVAFAGWRSRAWAPLALSYKQPAVASHTVSCCPAGILLQAACRSFPHSELLARLPNMAGASSPRLSCWMGSTTLAPEA